MTPPQRLLWRSAPLLLVLCVLFWAGNSIVGRALADTISPLALSFWRWLLALLILTPLAWRDLRTDARTLIARWKLILALAVTGVGSFGLLLYVGLRTTTAINAILLQAAIPPLIMLLGWVALRERTGHGEAAGMGLSLLGVLVVITSGRPWDLLHIGLNGGDAVILVGVGLYAIYSLLLRRRPSVAPLSLLWATFAVSALLLAPAFGAELAWGRPHPFSWRAAGGVAYVAVFPSLLAYLFYNRGIELLGAARASQFLHLQPAFGAALAVVLLGERFHGFHLAGLALIACGIALSSWSARRAAPT